MAAAAAVEDVTIDAATGERSPDACAAAIGDRTVELRATVGRTPLLVLRSAAAQPAILNAATCEEIPTAESDGAPDACVAAIGDRTVELRATVGRTPLLVLRSAAAQPAILNAATCEEIPASGPG